MTSGPVIVITRTYDNWPGGPRTSMPLDPHMEPNRHTYWFGAELNRDDNWVSFRTTLEAVHRMREDSRVATESTAGSIGSEPVCSSAMLMCRAVGGALSSVPSAAGSARWEQLLGGCTLCAPYRRETSAGMCISRPVSRCIQMGCPGAGERTRTADLLITNQLLYQLSYAGWRGNTHRSTAPWS